MFQIDILTLNIESLWLKYSPITLNPGSNFSSAMQWLNFLGQNDSIFSFSECMQYTSLVARLKRISPVAILIGILGMEMWNKLMEFIDAIWND